MHRMLLLATFYLAVCPGFAPAQESVADWTKKLTSKESADRLRAANELGKLGAGAAKAARALARTLEDEVPEVRNAAADALGKIGKPALPFVRNALADRDTHLAALRAAAELGPLAADLLPAITKCWLHATHESSEGVQECVRAIGAPALPHLIDCLGDNAINYDVCRALGNLGATAKPAVPGLIKVLGKRGVRAQETAAAALGRIGDPQAVPALLAAAEPGVTRIESVAATVTGNSVRALAQLRSEPDKVVPFLLRLLQSDRRDFEFVPIQREAIAALGAFDVRTAEVLDTLRAFLAAAPGENESDARRLLEKLSK